MDLALHIPEDSIGSVNQARLLARAFKGKSMVVATNRRSNNFKFFSWNAKNSHQAIE